MTASSVVTEKTFQYQDSLPNLPVPSLASTLAKYLDSVKPLVTEDEFAATLALVVQFEASDEAKLLHSKLLEKSKTERNWLEQWWEHYVYLSPRYPILPLVNFAGFYNNTSVWPSDPSGESQIFRASMMIHQTMLFWQLLRSERFAVQKSRRSVFCMDQFRRLFNTCRVPGLDVDAFRLHFKTEREGDAPSHVVVITNGHLFRLETVCASSGDLYTPPALETALNLIKLRAVGKSGSFVNALTCHNRPDYYRLRQHLISLNLSEHKYFYDEIESSVAIFVLTDELPQTENQLAWLGMFGDPRIQFADKSLICHVHRNGLIDNCCDHGPADAIASVMFGQHIHTQLEKIHYAWPARLKSLSEKTAALPPFSELSFVVDARIRDGINGAIEDVWRPLAENLDVLIWHFDGFANVLFKEAEIYGDTVVQLALQLAYYRLHAKPAPTYETATTRKFYHGRTETVRSCTPEAFEWCKAMLDSTSSKLDQGKKFIAAMRKQNRLMLEAVNGEGCDRHLIGLRILAKENGLSDPEIFSDPSWTKSGGDGNFVLSTSFEGYTQIYGGCAPMVQHGYGCFYKITDSEITFCFTGWKQMDTELTSWKSSVHWSLQAIHSLVRLRHSLPSSL